MLSAVLLLILALTFGASYGWDKASFIAPIVLSAMLFPAFFWYESRLPETSALLPVKLWKVPNFGVFMALGLIVYGWWSINFAPFVDTWFTLAREPGIIVALRLLPQGIAAAAISVIMMYVFMPAWIPTIDTDHGQVHADYSRTSKMVNSDSATSLHRHAYSMVSSALLHGYGLLEVSGAWHVDRVVRDADCLDGHNVSTHPLLAPNHR